jgi:hypothetical protein
LYSLEVYPKKRLLWMCYARNESSWLARIANRNPSGAVWGTEKVGELKHERLSTDNPIKTRERGKSL